MWSAVLLCGVLALGQAYEERVVSTAQGAVRGYPSELGDYFSFYGIPYATAPTGADKFKEALPPPTWDDIKEATDIHILCPQPNDSGGIFEAQEDCLIINVLVPKHALPEEKILIEPLPVMVYVHGGAFALGSGIFATHHLLVRHDVIVVNFNYRVGTYGFLCLGTEDVPGNAGLKDQVAALKWVQRNIANFGGNPEEVTIVGSSAGSVSVELLMLSPMAKGLFKRAISESGSALSTWAINPDPIETAKRFIKDVAYKNVDDILEIEEYFKNFTMYQLMSKMYLSESDSSMGFTPCIETEIDGHESFLSESPLEIIKSGKYNKVPYISGFGREEGLFRIDLFDFWKEEMETDFARFLPQDLTFVSDVEKNRVAERVKRFYFQDEPVSDDKKKNFVDYFTDVLFGYSTIRSARMHASNSVPVYLYEFSYVIEGYPGHAHSDEIKGAFHCAQCHTLHQFTFWRRDDVSDSDALMENRLTKMWTDFAKFGIPVQSKSDLLPVEWDTMDANTINYLSIGVELERKERLLGERVEFWDSIYGEYYRTPLPPHSPPPVVHTEL